MPSSPKSWAAAATTPLASASASTATASYVPRAPSASSSSRIRDAVNEALASDAPVGREATGASPQPLLSGALKDRALRLAGQLTRTMRPASGDEAGYPDASLASGAAGLAVCCGQLARTRSDRQAADAALTCLEEAVGVLATQP